LFGSFSSLNVVSVLAYKHCISKKLHCGGTVLFGNLSSLCPLCVVLCLVQVRGVDEGKYFLCKVVKEPWRLYR